MRPGRTRRRLMGGSGSSWRMKLSFWQWILLWTHNPWQMYFIRPLVHHIMMLRILVNFVQINLGHLQVPLWSESSRSWDVSELLRMIESTYKTHGQYQANYCLLHWIPTWSWMNSRGFPEIILAEHSWKWLTSSVTSIICQMIFFWAAI